MSFKEYKQIYPEATIKSPHTLSISKITLENCVTRYGEKEGRRRFDSYRQKQAVSNSFEYKQQKHGWTREQYNAFNKSRAQTRENMIKRYGETVGTQKWEAYVSIQQYAGSSEQYFIDKLGEEEGRKKWREINQMKSHSISTYILRYGEELGKKEYFKWVEQLNKKVFFSRVSQDLFKDIDDGSYKIYYATHNNGEYFIFDSVYKKVRFFDYVDTERKKCIEFNGDCFHANPKFYTATCRPNFRDRTLTSADIWLADEYKNSLITNRGYEILVVWEDEYVSHPVDTIQKCKDFIYGKNI